MGRLILRYWKAPNNISNVCGLQLLHSVDLNFLLSVVRLLVSMDLLERHTIHFVFVGEILQDLFELVQLEIWRLVVLLYSNFMQKELTSPVIKVKWSAQVATNLIFLL